MPNGYKGKFTYQLTFYQNVVSVDNCYAFFNSKNVRNSHWLLNPFSAMVWCSYCISSLTFGQPLVPFHFILDCLLQTWLEIALPLSLSVFVRMVLVSEFHIQCFRSSLLNVTCFSPFKCGRLVLIYAIIKLFPAYLLILKTPNISWAVSSPLNISSLGFLVHNANGFLDDLWRESELNCSVTTFS